MDRSSWLLALLPPEQGACPGPREDYVALRRRRSASVLTRALREDKHGRMGLRRILLALLLACIPGLAACAEKKKPVMEDDYPPRVTLKPDPPPSGLPRVVPPPAVAGRRAGDRVSVRYGGTCYPARIVSAPRPGTYFITY